MRIVVAMSGGVDSSVAAARLAREGHDVIGLSMQLYDHSRTAEGEQQQGDVRFGSCCTLDDLYDARRVARSLGIPHYIVNFEQRFEEHVLSDFVREYAAGRTPIPCVHCNGDLKFASLVDRAAAFGADAVATGHYAQVDRDPDTGRFRLKRGVDRGKDQSYFLFTLSQDQLAHAQFPVGALDKPAVRDEARRLGLDVADKPDSQEICFVAAGERAGFVERRSSVPGGAIRDRDGHVIGHHDGVHRFTVGQRKGLGLASPIPLYVVGIDAASATVTVGPRDALERSTLTASRVNWISGDAPSRPIRAHARIRYRHAEAPATITPLDGHRASIEFDAPQTAVTPGQAVVFYDGEFVVGGGWID
ncbi:MAG: tRNA 2-thiouridine(34) synthase MnmA [Acidobacteria bacterium]|nr:MAG: tRNA 2-thiouridine(34) synthase MnmA [Acidobacteriota bacterium]